MAQPLILIFDTGCGAVFEIKVTDVSKGVGEVYMKHEDVLLDMEGWKFKDLWGNAYEVVYAPDWRDRFSAFLQVWTQKTIARIDRPKHQMTA